MLGAVGPDGKPFIGPPGKPGALTYGKIMNLIFKILLIFRQ
jgi:hypothetical protein